MLWRKTKLKLAVSLLLLGLINPGAALAQSSSPNYSIEESFIGPGGLIDASSPSYQVRASLGDTGIGNLSSPGYQLWAGYTTTDQEFIEMVVSAMTVSAGDLTTSTTGTATATFYVRNYLSKGYVVTTASNPPRNGSYTLAGMNPAAASAVGTEQFGINLVANTSPTTFGANPSQNPDSSFSFGEAAPGYNTTNTYKYVKDETIARSLTSSGRTDYTISYIFNITNTTAGGVYAMDHILVATATY